MSASAHWFGVARSVASIAGTVAEAPGVPLVRVAVVHQAVVYQRPTIVISGHRLDCGCTRSRTLPQSTSAAGVQEICAEIVYLVPHSRCTVRFVRVGFIRKCPRQRLTWLTLIAGSDRVFLHQASSLMRSVPSPVPYRLRCLKSQMLSVYAYNV
jgi:hypothetical protein